MGWCVARGSMRRTALLIFALLTVSQPLMAKPQHAHRLSAHHRHHASHYVAHDHSNITCAMVRAYVEQVGLQQALMIAQSSGMTVSDKEKARRCIASKT